MKLATYRLTPDAPGTPPDVPPGASWARFGDEVLLVSDEARWDASAERPGRGALRECRASVEREHLHVVVQNGRLFEQEHPDVPVILNRGRILLVDLERERARRLAEGTRPATGCCPCGIIRSYSTRATRPPSEARRLPGSKNSSPSWWAPLEADLAHLVSFPTRYSTSAHFANAAAWAREQLEAMGYVARLQDIVVDGNPGQNVVADKEGHANGARGVVLVTAHLDSINTQGGPAAPAPGADDNGSGSAGLIEMMRAFEDHRGEHDLRAVLFGGEEEGLLGSKQYLANLPAAERERIRAVVNMDMIGTLNVPTHSVLIEGAPSSQKVIDRLSQAAMTYTRLAVETSLHPFASDHVPFIDAGIPAVLTIEGADGTNVHSGADTIDHIDYDFALEILRMNVAFVARMVGRVPR